MTIAAKQCREYVVDRYPGVRISRRACRDTTKGGISQHSAYKNSYDSNALDIMGGPRGWTWEENVELIQQIVDDLNEHLTAWSIRKILWKVSNHYGHAHIDFYPMIDIHKWCATKGVPEAPWKYSDGHIERHANPEPENGRYEGATLMPTAQWHQMIRSLFEGRPDEFKGDPQYWIDLDVGSSEWGTGFWPAFVRAISLDNQ